MKAVQFSAVETSVKVYRALLRLYPAEHREEYGWLMTQVFRDKAYDVYIKDGDAGMILYWWATLLDLVSSVIKERREKGITMSLENLAKIRRPLMMLSGVMVALSAFSELKPGFWWQAHSNPLYDAWDLLFVPGVVVFGIAMLGMLAALRRALSPAGKLGLVGAVAGCATIGVLAFIDTTAGLGDWEDLGWGLFMLAMAVLQLGLILFSTAMIRAGYRFLSLLLIHPILFFVVWAVSIAQEYGGDTPGPHWDNFAALASWGIAWLIVGYLFRNDPLPAARNSDTTFSPYLLEPKDQEV